jgi:hypothetical protein
MVWYWWIAKLILSTKKNLSNFTMNKQQIKARILQIINRTAGYITADEIYNRLSRNVDPGRTQETIRKYIRELVNEQHNLIGSSNNVTHCLSASCFTPGKPLGLF